MSAPLLALAGKGRSDLWRAMEPSEYQEKSQLPPKKKKEPKPPPPARYPLRVDVAKPAVVYQPSFDKAKPSPVKEGSGQSPSGSGSGTPRERILGKRRRGGRTEFLVKRPGAGEATWESSKNVTAGAVAEFEEKRQNRQLLQSRIANAKQAKQGASTSAVADPDVSDKTAYRILAQRRFEGGQRYLVHWAGMSVTNASWESAKRLNNPALVQEFETAVSTPSCQLRNRPPLPPSALRSGAVVQHHGPPPCPPPPPPAPARLRYRPQPSMLRLFTLALLSLSPRTGQARTLHHRGPAFGPHPLLSRLPARPRLPRALLAQSRRV